MKGIKSGKITPLLPPRYAPVASGFPLYFQTIPVHSPLDPPITDNKENLPIKQKVDLQLLNETIIAEISLKRKKIFFIISYRHRNQSADEVANYIMNLGNIIEIAKLEKPACIILTGDFNARRPLFWEEDTETLEGRLFSDFTVSNCLEEFINEHTHIRENGTQTCIDLICTDQPYIFTE